MDKEPRNLVQSNMIGVDILRIAAAFAVYLFHINTNLKFRTGFDHLDRVISVGAIFMVCFFMMSGFLFSYRYGKVDLFENCDALKIFYKKRLLRILPGYYIFLLVVFLFRLSFPADTKSLILMIPVDLLGLQAFFSKTFNLLGNGGTWYISVTLFLYIIYPFLQKIINIYFTKFWRVFLFVYFCAVWISLTRVYWGGDFSSYYANPIFRIPDFCIGMLLGQYQREQHEKKTKVSTIANGIIILLTLLIAFIYSISIIYLFDKKLFGVDFFKTNYLSYNIIAIPLFACLIFLLSNLRFSLDKSKKTAWYNAKSISLKVITHCSNLTFYFYLTQTLANRLTAAWIKKSYFGFCINGDKKIMLVSFVLNMLFAEIMWLITEKKLHPILKKIVL